MIRPLWKCRFELKPDCWVFVPSKDATSYGKSVKAMLEKRWRPPSFFYHLRKGGHVAAIKSHLSSTYFAHLDIRQFFNHISRSRVTRALVPYFGYDVGREIAINSTVCLPNSVKYFLPYGFVQSPILASICLQKSKLGRYLTSLAREQDVVVSVYVDDIIISSKDQRRLQAAVDELCNKAEESKLPINDGKLQRASGQTTGFNILLANQHLEIVEERLEKFKQLLSESDNPQQRFGVVNYVGTISIAQRDELLRNFPA